MLSIATISRFVSNIVAFFIETVQIKCYTYTYSGTYINLYMYLSVFEFE